MTTRSGSAAKGPRLAISVIGGNYPAERVLRQAYEVGAGLARRGAVLVCGGRGGVMEAACQGAKDAGGLTIGILPGSDASEANDWVDVAIPTGIGWARNSIVVNSGAAVIALEGAFGTLSEMAFAIIGGVPLIGLGAWEFGPSSRLEEHVRRVATPAEAVEAALAAAIEEKGSRQ